MREQVITRTITEKRATVLAMDIEKSQAVEKVLVYTGNGKTDAEILKALKKANDTTTFSVVAIKKVETVETLYGMTVQEFMKHAKVMNDRFEKIN